MVVWVIVHGGAGRLGMNLFSVSDTKWIDRFEAAWQKSSNPNLRKWLKPCFEATRVELATELCAIDLEWRWRLSRESRTISKKPWQTAFPNCPFAEDYRELLGDFWGVTELRQRLAMVEWGVRNLWGDRPDTDSFQSKYPEDSDWQGKLETHLDSLLPLDVSIRKGGELVMERHLPARFELGRQRKEEPASPAWVGPAVRLLIASSQDRLISRKQVELRRTRRGELEIKNLTGSYSVQMDLTVLKPMQCDRFELPVTLRFGDVLVSFCEAFSDR